MHIVRLFLISVRNAVITFRPDGNSIPSRILDLIGKYQEGYDMVICSRFTDYAKCEEDDFVTRFGN